MEFFKREKPSKLEGAAKEAVERGDAVPTIQTALSDEDAFPYLFREIRNMSASDRSAFANGLDAAISDLELDKPLPSNIEMWLKTYGVTMLSMTALLIVAAHLGYPPPGGGAPHIGGAIAGGAFLNQHMRMQQRPKQEMLKRLRMLRQALN